MNGMVFNLMFAIPPVSAIVSVFYVMYLKMTKRVPYVDEKNLLPGRDDEFIRIHSRMYSQWAIIVCFEFVYFYFFSHNMSNQINIAMAIIIYLALFFVYMQSTYRKRDLFIHDGDVRKRFI